MGSFLSLGAAIVFGIFVQNPEIVHYSPTPSAVSLENQAWVHPCIMKLDSSKHSLSVLRLWQKKRVFEVKKIKNLDVCFSREIVLRIFRLSGTNNIEQIIPWNGFRIKTCGTTSRTFDNYRRSFSIINDSKRHAPRILPGIIGTFLRSSDDLHKQPRSLDFRQSSFRSADGPLRKAPLLNGSVFQSVSERGNDDSRNGANPAGILVHESEEPVNEVITDDIFAGILLVCGAYAWFKWCNGKSGENENDDDGPVDRVISKKPEP